MKKILIIEDEEAYRRIIYDQLIKNGYEVIVAVDGEEGLRMALKDKPNLILLDLMMPKLEGLKMLNNLNRFKEGLSIPVFILTNVNDSNITTEAMYSHASKYFVKSDTKIEDLLGNINTYLKGG
ncbi:MAG: response regulator [Candidatus Levybacteria bacterium]|nr:response regulator [Candidatus Levybacteria bacterium]MBP9815103.1 response regulator [Candidatus Levybacteria bacterium]